MSLVLWSSKSRARQSEDATISVSVSAPPYIPGPYEDCASLKTSSQTKFYYVPPPIYFCIRRLAPYPDQVHQLHPFLLRYTPRDDAEFDILKALLPSYDSESLSNTDPRLWATIVQIYSSTLPSWLDTYRIPLSDVHVPFLQTVTPTSTCSIVTVLDLPGCPELSDDTILVLKALTGMVALDASKTSLTSWGISQLALCCGPGLKGPWGLRILRLRDTKGINSSLFKNLHRFRGLSVLDLRGTSVVPAKIPQPYSTSSWSPAHIHSGLEKSVLKNLYHPIPLHESLSTLLKESNTLSLPHQTNQAGPNSNATIFSSTSVYQLYVDRLNHIPHGTNYIHSHPRSLASPSGSNVKLENTAVTFSPVEGRVTAAPSAISIQHGQVGEINPMEHDFMNSIAAEEDRVGKSSMNACRFHMGSGSLFSSSWSSLSTSQLRSRIDLESEYSAEDYYRRYRLREERQKARTTFMPSFEDGGSRSIQACRSSGKSDLIAGSGLDPLMLYRIPLPWTELVELMEQGSGSSTSKITSASPPKFQAYPASSSSTASTRRDTDKTRMMLERQRDVAIKRRRLDTSVDESFTTGTGTVVGTGTHSLPAPTFQDPANSAGSLSVSFTRPLMTLSAFPRPLSSSLASVSSKSKPRSGLKAASAHKLFVIPKPSFRSGDSGDAQVTGGGNNGVKESKMRAPKSTNRLHLNDRDSMPVKPRGVGATTSNHNKTKVSPTFTGSSAPRSGPEFSSKSGAPLTAWPSFQDTVAPDPSARPVRYVDSTQMNGLSSTGKRLKPISTIRVPELPVEERMKLKERVSMEVLSNTRTLASSTYSDPKGERKLLRAPGAVGSGVGKVKNEKGSCRRSGDIRHFMIRNTGVSASASSGEPSQRV